jgi:hypothetical protein
VTPQTEQEWRQALAAVHPDRTGDASAFLALSQQRAAWKIDHPGACQWCGGPRRKRQRRFCSLPCCGRGVAAQRAKAKGLKSAHIAVAVPLRHAAHADVFGAFARCQHTACVRARGER